MKRFWLMAMGLLLVAAACDSDGDGYPTTTAPTGEGPEQAPGQATEQAPGDASEREGAYPEVWSINEQGSQSYEFKSNCFDGYDTLEECSLWDVTAVIVTGPDGRTFPLEKDLNVNEYSGEVTRRWVLYGPEDGGLPIAGDYEFAYQRDGQRDGTAAFTQTVAYAPEVVGYPTDVDWRWDGDDLHVTWTPAPGMAKGMWYKVVVFPEGGNVLSEVFVWREASAVLTDLPLAAGQYATLNVAAYFSGGYAPSAYFELDYGL
jgi:hypothetical protein